MSKHQEKKKKTDTQEKETIPNNQIRRLYDGKLGGSDIESVDVGGQPGEGLLGSIGPRKKKRAVSMGTAELYMGGELRKTNLIKVLTLTQSTS